MYRVQIGIYITNLLPLFEPWNSDHHVDIARKANGLYYIMAKRLDVFDFIFNSR